MMGRAFLHYEQGKAHQLAAMQALAGGLDHHGIKAVVSSGWDIPPGAQLVATWGDRTPREYRDRQRLILEAGYINGSGADYNANRLRFIRTSWNAQGMAGDWHEPEKPAPGRWAALNIALKPWRKTNLFDAGYVPDPNKYVLLLEQHPGDAAAPAVEDFRKQVEIACEARGWPLHIRHHPSYQGNSHTLAVDLAGAALAVTWSSTAAIEAVIEGVPTYAFNRNAITAPVTRPSFLYKPYYGDRLAWARSLAFRQWTLAELANGSAWWHIRHHNRK
jgi:hypothetical protein